MVFLRTVLEYRVIIVKQVQVASAAFLRRPLRRTSTAGSDLSKVATAALLHSLSVMDIFLEILQEF